MDIEQARFNMIEQQIRPWEVLDPRVLSLLEEVRREDFVPPEYRHLAFADMQIPLGFGEVMMQPKMEARLLQALAIGSSDRVLEIGTGSGYMTALLASLGEGVDSVEIEPALSEQAMAKLERAGISNVRFEVGDGARGWDRHGPYDAVILTGSLPFLPGGFEQAMAPGGRLVAVVGQPPIMEAVLVERIGEGGCQTVSLFDTSLPPLRNAEAPSAFVF